MLIPEHKIEEVLERIDLVTLVSRHVELKKAGRSFKGRCPFHQEKTPSFQVTPEMRRFKCFGCGAGGDAIAFVQRYLGKTFVDAVRELAREAGVDLEAAVDPGARERQQLKEVTDLAAEHFRARLVDPVAGSVPRQYLRERGVSEETERTFGLGWAPLAWTELADRARASGMLEWAELAGLVAPRARGEGYYDVFRGRLIIPIRAPEGRPIAFGGRLLEGEGGPKYLNSKESRLFNKSETLYGLDQAREEIRRRRAAVLVEGYFDCMGLHQVGVRRAVALCSTVLTPGHLRLLARAEASELFLLLDGDEAGRKAVERLAGALFTAGTPTRVALLPEGEDPDTFARRVGTEGVEALLEKARPLSEHLLQTVLPEGRRASFEAKMKALERLRPTLSQLPVGLARSAFIGAVASHAGVPGVELEASLRGKSPSAASLPRAPPPPTPAPAERPPEMLESTFVALVLREPSFLVRDVYRISDELRHPGLRTVVAQLQAGTPPSEALFDTTDRVKRALETTQRGLPREPEALEETFWALAKRLKLKRIDEQLTHISHTTQAIAEASELSEDTRRLQAERIELLALRKRVLAEPTHSGLGTKTPTQQV